MPDASSPPKAPPTLLPYPYLAAVLLHTYLMQQLGAEQQADRLFEVLLHEVYQESLRQAAIVRQKLWKLWPDKDLQSFPDNGYCFGGYGYGSSLEHLLLDCLSQLDHLVRNVSHRCGWKWKRRIHCRPIASPHDQNHRYYPNHATVSVVSYRIATSL